MERSFLFTSEYGFIVSQAAEFVTKRRKKAPGAGALRGRKIRVYFAASRQPPRRSAPSSVYPPPEPGVPCPEHPVLRPWKEDAQFFSDFVPELLKITQFYHFFMVK
jgi:hypothetical protein